MLVPPYPPCSCVFLSRLKLRNIHAQRGGYFSHQAWTNQDKKRSPKKQRNSTNFYASLTRMARKPYPVHNILAYQCTYKFQRTGRHRYTDLLCKKQYVAIAAWDQKNKHMIHKINMNSYHENMDSSSTGSTHDTLLPCFNNKNIFISPPLSKHRTSVLRAY